MVAPTGRSNGRPKNIDTSSLSNHSAFGIPVYPAGLKLAGKATWDRLWLTGTWLDREQSYEQVTNYCQKVEEILEWKKELEFLKKLSKQEHGFALTSYQQSNGAWAPYPAVRLIHEGRAQLQAWLHDLKMTAIEIPDVTGEDDYLASVTKQNRG